MNMIMINCVMTVVLAALGAGVASLVREAVRDRATRTAHVSWTVRYDAVTAKYERDDYWTARPVTLAKRSDGAVRPSWLYDGPNRRMLRASEIAEITGA